VERPDDGGEVVPLPERPFGDGDLTASVVGLARTLRAAGVDASPDRVHAFVEALTSLRAHDRDEVYWAGRLTLCAGPDDLDRYDRVFAAFFDGETVSSRATVRRQVRIGPRSLGAEVGNADDTAVEVEGEAVTRHASREEVLRHRDVSDLGPQEKRELHRLLAAFALPGETRRTRRFDPARRGRIDRRRSVRAAVEAGGEPGRLHHRTPRHRPRRVVLLVDVSGSMAGYADTLLRFAHVATRRQGPRTEVFTLGTRRTRVTGPLRHRDPDTAMRAVSAAIPDWSGGTRLGEGLRTFLDLWGQRGTARGAVVVILSDGWETGDLAGFEGQVARLERLAHRLVWANPRAGRPGFEPTAGGMAAALPYCDDLVEGHSLAALEHLARVVAGAARGDEDATTANRWSGGQRGPGRGRTVASARGADRA
jgi:uncharacterized protein